MMPLGGYAGGAGGERMGRGRKEGKKESGNVGNGDADTEKHRNNTQGKEQRTVTKILRWGQHRSTSRRLLQFRDLR